MGCGCGGAASQPEQWEVTLPDGTKKIATSDAQARQWIARYGGGLIKQVKA